MEPTKNDPKTPEEETVEVAQAEDTGEAQPEAPKKTKPLFEPKDPRDVKLGKRHQSPTKARLKPRIKRQIPAKNKKKKH